MNLQNNKELVQLSPAKEQAQRLKDSVNIIAVTKYVDCETTQELFVRVFSISEKIGIDKFQINTML